MEALRPYLISNWRQVALIRGLSHRTRLGIAFSPEDVYAKAEKWVYDLQPTPKFATGFVDDEGAIATGIAIYADQKLAKAALRAGF